MPLFGSKRRMAREKLLEHGIMLYKKDNNVKGAEIARSAKLPNPYIGWCFGSTEKFWEAVRAAIKSEQKKP